MGPTSVPLEQFEQNRSRLTSIAVRMLGSRAEADDAVQETWLRVSRAPDPDIANVPAWLTTITARVCLNILRSRATRREDPFADVTVDPVTFASDPQMGEVTNACAVEHACHVAAGGASAAGDKNAAH